VQRLISTLDIKHYYKNYMTNSKIGANINEWILI